VIEISENMTKAISVNTKISSENIILDAFTTRGFIGGGLVILIFVYFLSLFLRLRKYAKKLNNIYPDMNLFVTMIASLFISILLMANTYLFRHTDHIWWLIFASGVIIERVIYRIQVNERNPYNRIPKK
jgi:hypothetical protein